MHDSFLGYERPVGRAGIRNHVLLLPIDRYANETAWTIAQSVKNVRRFVCPGDMGRTAPDRQRLADVMRGIACNPNVGAVVLIGVDADFNYPETHSQLIIDAVAAAQKPIVPLFMAEAGGVAQTVTEGIRQCRLLARDLGRQPRKDVPLGDLSIGIKCGTSDGTSGVSGNPSLGAAMDLLVARDGTAIFSETTEIVGAEDVLAARCADQATAQRILEMAQRIEAQSFAVGEDLRSINPIPANIKAGISTLAEKSLGAISKGGTTPLQGALEYAEAPLGRGLYFMDGWMASNSLPMALAAAGAQITVLQSGGANLPMDPPLAATTPGLVSPNFYMSGNPEFVTKLTAGLDFDASGVLTRSESLTAIGEQLMHEFVSVASGMPTFGETLAYEEEKEIWFDGPAF